MLVFVLVDCPVYWGVSGHKLLIIGSITNEVGFIMTIGDYPQKVTSTQQPLSEVVGLKKAIVVRVLHGR